MQLANQWGVCRVSEWWGCSVKNIEINNCCRVAADAGALKREKGGFKGEMLEPLTSGFWFFHCFVVCFFNLSGACYVKIKARMVLNVGTPHKQ